MVAVAMMLNEAAYRMFEIFGIVDIFNMFYISPYFPCTLLILDSVWRVLPYGLFVCVYFFGFIFCALVVYGLIREITKGSHNSVRSIEKTFEG